MKRLTTVAEVVGLAGQQAMQGGSFVPLPAVCHHWAKSFADLCVGGWVDLEVDEQVRQGDTHRGLPSRLQTCAL